MGFVRGGFFGVSFFERDPAHIKQGSIFLSSFFFPLWLFYFREWGRDVFISVASFLQVMCAHLRDGKCMEEGTISYIAYYLYLCITHTIPVRSTWST